VLLVSHIIIALTSLVVAGCAWISPSRLRLRASYAFVALTLISGTALVATRMSHLASACVSGLVYLGVVGVLLVAAERQLAAASRD
jgi:hypothetical protein